MPKGQYDLNFQQHSRNSSKLQPPLSPPAYEPTTSSQTGSTQHQLQAIMTPIDRC